MVFVLSLTAQEDYPSYRDFFPLSTDAHRQLRVKWHKVMESDWKKMKKNQLPGTTRLLWQAAGQQYYCPNLQTQQKPMKTCEYW
jgi:hypothetical protein